MNNACLIRQQPKNNLQISKPVDSDYGGNGCETPGKQSAKSVETNDQKKYPQNLRFNIVNRMICYQVNIFSERNSLIHNFNVLNPVHLRSKIRIIFSEKIV